MEWIMKHHHSFNETESKALHKIFEYLNPRSTKGLMSKKTIRSDVIKYFETTKAMITIVAHWTLKDYKVKTMLLAIREIHEEYTGENIANVVYPVLNEYNIHDRFGYYVATNNDTSLEWLNQHLHNEGNKQFNPDQ